MKVLVTGGQGFLGRYIVEQLAASGRPVRALVRRSAPELTALGVEAVSGDLTDAEAVSAAADGCDVVYHAGAIAGIGGSWETYEAVNVRGTEHVLAACVKHGVRKLVYTSSPSVTFGGEDQCNVDETAPYPKTWLAWYPKSKAIAEAAVLAADGRETPQGRLRTCALRPHLIWGPRDGHLIPRLLERARKGRLRQVGTGKNRVDMVYVENAASAHLLAEQRLEEGSPLCGQAVFITQQAPVECWTWINEILGLAGLPPVRKRISTRAAYAVGAVLEGVYKLCGWREEPPMTRFLALQLGTHHYFDPRRARDWLGYEPRVSTEEGMKRLAAWLHQAKAST